MKDSERTTFVFLMFLSSTSSLGGVGSGRGKDPALFHLSAVFVVVVVTVAAPAAAVGVVFFCC